MAQPLGPAGRRARRSRDPRSLPAARVARRVRAATACRPSDLATGLAVDDRCRARFGFLCRASDGTGHRRDSLRQRRAILADDAPARLPVSSRRHSRITTPNGRGLRGPPGPPRPGPFAGPPGPLPGPRGPLPAPPNGRLPPGLRSSPPGRRPSPSSRLGPAVRKPAGLLRPPGLSSRRGPAGRSSRRGPGPPARERAGRASSCAQRLRFGRSSSGARASRTGSSVGGRDTRSTSTARPLRSFTRPLRSCGFSPPSARSCLASSPRRGILRCGTAPGSSARQTLRSGSVGCRRGGRGRSSGSGAPSRTKRGLRAGRSSSRPGLAPRVGRSDR